MIQWIGAVLLVAGCGAYGFALGAASRREMGMLRRLGNGLQEVEWELKYRMTELPELCRLAAEVSGGVPGEIFREMAEKLDRHEVSDLGACFNAIVSGRDLPRRVQRNFRQLGTSLGRYDLDGQLEGLQAVRTRCLQDLKALEENSAQRIRSYQTLALCAGMSLAILLI